MNVTCMGWSSAKRREIMSFFFFPPVSDLGVYCILEIRVLHNKHSLLSQEWEKLEEYLGEGRECAGSRVSERHESPG